MRTSGKALRGCMSRSKSASKSKAAVHILSILQCIFRRAGASLRDYTGAFGDRVF